MIVIVRSVRFEGGTSIAQLFAFSAVYVILHIESSFNTNIMSIRKPLFLLATLFLLLPGLVSAASGTVTTFIGAPYRGDGLDALQAYLDMPNGMVHASDGSTVIADTINNAIRSISSSNVMSTLSGNGEYGNKNGSASTATWSEPQGITQDSDGTFFVADTGSNSIRKISSSIVSKLAISGLKGPTAVVVDGNTLYIADAGNNRVVSAPKTGGSVTVLASGFTALLKIVQYGSTLYAVDNGTGEVIAINITAKTKGTLAAGMTEPRAITYYSGLLYVTAGASGIWNELWSVNPATGASALLFRNRETESLNQTSDIFITEVESTPTAYMLQRGGSAIYAAGLDGSNLTQSAGKNRYGDDMGIRSAALLGRPEALAASKDGKKLYVSYERGNAIAMYSSATNAVSFIAGSPMDNYVEGTGTSARFSEIPGMVVSPDGKTLYVADRNSQRIRSVTIATGTTHYLTGAGIINLIDPSDPTGLINPDIKNGYAEGAACADTFTRGVAGCAYFDRPTGLAITKNGKTLYVADASNNRIRKVAIATGATSLVAGSSKGLKNGIGKNAKFDGPYAVVLSADEKKLYVTDKGNSAIRQIVLATKKVTTLAGNGKRGYREGTFAKARFSTPEYITLGPDGNLYVSETGTLRVRKLDLKKGIVSLAAGSGNRGMKNGAAPTAEFNVPKGLAFFNGSLLVADVKNDLIRSVTIPGVKATKVKIRKK